MALSDHVYQYCERGTDSSLWAEPFNAASNGAFIVAALAGLAVLLRRPAAERSADHYLLIALVFIIGLGSAAFHILATPASELADTVPIGLFMLVYLAYALNRLLGAPVGWTVLVVIGFTGLMALATQLKCWDGVIGFDAPAGINGDSCLNGSGGYLPALGAMLLIGGLLWAKGAPSGRLILWAGLIFAGSVSFRSLDMAMCPQTVIQGHAAGTHFAWHLLNGVTLFLLLLAAFPGPARKALPAPEETGSLI